MDEREKLAAAIVDESIIRAFYLDRTTEATLVHIDALQLNLVVGHADVPFNAAVKGYIGAADSDGDAWILKPTLSTQETLYHRICTLAFLLDHAMGTLSAPTSVFKIDGKDYRAVKVVANSIQISSYNYLERPFIDWLRTDLINRWLYFDEDRNPNNYLVIRTRNDTPYIVAIDFDKADFQSTDMKITGTEAKFGWIRSEKTRFLTLLRPENFLGVPIETFEARLHAMMDIPVDAIKHLALHLVDGYCDDPETLSATLTTNIVNRRNYIDAYFRKMFQLESQTRNLSNSDDYSMFGASFLSQYEGKN